jgi:outer membrane protein assembly factor BamA
MIGSCFDEDSEEMEERVRASVQDRGYFKAEVKSLRFKPHDPLSVPKPVMLEGEVSEGARYKLAEITFVENHAFSSKKLREQFPLKRGDLFERRKIASGIESLRKLYGARGFLDWIAVPETEFASNATASLNISIQEGPQYHMGKLDIVADKEVAARLRAAWRLAEGDVYDNTYIDQFLEANRDLLL